MSGGYFPADYFGATTPGMGLIAPDQPLTDAMALCWIRDTLVDSEIFASVQLGRVVTVSNGEFPAAWVYPVGFTEVDDVDPTQITRKLMYAVGITVRVESDDVDSELAGIGRLDALSNAVANLLSSDGPEGYIPGLSRIESGKYDTIPLGTRDAPEIGTAFTGITIYGSLCYLVEGRFGRDQA